MSKRDTRGKRKRANRLTPPLSPAAARLLDLPLAWTCCHPVLVRDADGRIIGKRHHPTCRHARTEP
jgi:hypothetical protein